MFHIYNTTTRSVVVLFLVVVAGAGLNAAAYYLPFDLVDLFGGAATSRVDLISYAPEVWLSLLVMVFGTLIIVISIASSSTPKLIDLYIGEYYGLFYIWFIVLACVENSFLQIQHGLQQMFYDNLIFLINYFLLPIFTVLAIPYIFYILKYTTDSNVINKIFQENLYTIASASRLHDQPGRINENHRHLFETVNQLDDLLEYAKFKDPMGNIINKLGLSLRFYLGQKAKFQKSYFVLGDSVKQDVSFKTLSERFREIEENRIFYEQKVFRVISASYNRLLQQGFFDLASLCGGELYESGKTAVELGDDKVSGMVMIEFNTMMRYGINQAKRTQEIRSLYDLIIYYSQMITLFIDRHEDEKVIRCCRYLAYYGKAANDLRFSEPSFAFLIDVFAVELKKALIGLHSSRSSRDVQTRTMAMFNELCSLEGAEFPRPTRPGRRELRMIRIALCLFYLEQGEHKLCNLISDGILRDLSFLGEDEITATLTKDCEQLENETKNFWEETDRGTRNIYYSPHLSQLQQFMTLTVGGRKGTNQE